MNWNGIGRFWNVAKMGSKCNLNCEVAVVNNQRLVNCS